MKILVIDDDDLILTIVSTALRDDGHDVVTAENGLRGMTLLRQERPRLVITDILMPEQEGIETILAIRREDPDVRIIAMSGSGTIGGTGVLRMAQLLGADDAIAKPFRARDLLDRVRALGESSAVTSGLK